MQTPDAALPDPRYGLGLEPTSNRLVDHNPLWRQAFEEEAARIAQALGPAAIEIEHYGSTAVPGLRAKPIIDLQIGVAHIDVALGFIPPMARLGYDDAGDQGISEHRIFGRGQARSFLAHVVVHRGEQWFRSLRFRDRLRADPAVRQAYAELKGDLAASSRTRAEYTAGKAAFVARYANP